MKKFIRASVANNMNSSSASFYQRGISLFVVLIILLLTALLVLGSLKTSLFNESIVGNQSDIQRANSRAEALLLQAQNEIRASLVGCTTDICKYPVSKEAYAMMYMANPRGCGTSTTTGSLTPLGVCMPAATDDSFFTADTIGVSGKPLAIGNAQSYTAFGSGTKAGDSSNGVDLSLTAAKGQYWVEVFLFKESALTSMANENQMLKENLPVPEPTFPFIYRITVRAEGAKPGTVSIVRSNYIPFVKKIES